MEAIDRARTEEFIRLVDAAISLVREMRAFRDCKSMAVTLENLDGFRWLALTGKLPRPSKGEVPLGTGLGLSRNISEWTESDDLLNAVYAIEEFYTHAM